MIFFQLLNIYENFQLHLDDIKILNKQRCLQCSYAMYGLIITGSSCIAMKYLNNKAN